MSQKVSARELREHREQFERAMGWFGTVQCPGCPAGVRVDPKQYDGYCWQHSGYDRYPVEWWPDEY